MIDGLEKDYQSNILLYKSDNSKLDILVDSIKKLDIEYTREYLNVLKKYINKASSIDDEANRLENIIKCINDRTNKRNKMLDDIKNLNIDVSLPSIPNIDKLNCFSNKLKVIKYYLNVMSKLNESNKNNIIDILKRKEFRVILKEFSLIKEDSDGEIINFINSKVSVKDNTNMNNNVNKNITNNISDDNKGNNLRILDSYYDNLKYFNDIDIPNMGLVVEKNSIDLDNKNFFNN